ncbi:hypothetical protein PN836_003085 [Ningiella sp. W23]|uniref:hypothetical protein n=1 Tax=Ningiella sp. W23 TaxID=3023715 RepID=UPI00375730AA
MKLHRSRVPLALIQKMKRLHIQSTFLVVVFAVFSCSSTSGGSTNHPSKQYQRIIIQPFVGDTSKYVQNYITKALSEFHEILTSENIGNKDTLKLINARTNKQDLEVLSSACKGQSADAILLGQVKSGAVAISESARVLSTIKTAFFDCELSAIVFSSLKEEETNVYRERRSSLREVTQQTSDEYLKFLKN